MLGLLSVGLYYFSTVEIRLEICHFLGSLLSLLPSSQTPLPQCLLSSDPALHCDD